MRTALVLVRCLCCSLTGTRHMCRTLPGQKLAPWARLVLAQHPQWECIRLQVIMHSTMYHNQDSLMHTAGIEHSRVVTIWACAANNWLNAVSSAVQEGSPLWRWSTAA